MKQVASATCFRLVVELEFTTIDITTFIDLLGADNLLLG